MSVPVLTRVHRQGWSARTGSGAWGPGSPAGGGSWEQGAVGLGVGGQGVMVEVRRLGGWGPGCQQACGCGDLTPPGTWALGGWGGVSLGGAAWLEPRPCSAAALPAARVQQTEMAQLVPSGQINSRPAVYFCRDHRLLSPELRESPRT